MTTTPRRILTGVLAALLAGVCVAQDAETPKAPPETVPKPAAIEDEAIEAENEAVPDEEPAARRRMGRFYVEGTVWFVQPTGLNYSPASVFTNPDGTNAQVITLDFHTQSTLRSRFGWVLPDDYGEIIGTYVGYSQTSTLLRSEPGNHVFVETETRPLYAGVNDDGLADAFVSEATVLLREVSFDYARPAFETPRASGKWFAGWRRITQKWTAATQYHAIIAPPGSFPSEVPPGAGLDPLPDQSLIHSEYNGRGLETGLDVKFPFGRNRKFAVETGFTVAALRGKVYTTSSSANSYYFTNPEGVTTQLISAIGLTSPNISKSAMALDIYLGFRWRVWQDLEVFGGMRDQYNDGAGELRRAWEPTSPTTISATHEGFYLGVGYLF